MYHMYNIIDQEGKEPAGQYAMYDATSVEYFLADSGYSRPDFDGGIDPHQPEHNHYLPYVAASCICAEHYVNIFQYHSNQRFCTVIFAHNDTTGLS